MLSRARRFCYVRAMDRIVHLTNGDHTADVLSLADLPGEILVCADALDQGPVQPVADDEHRRIRAAFWASRGTPNGAAKLAEYDQAIETARDAEELVLWFEHDLFDQLALIRILARLQRGKLPATLTIVSIDRHPEVPNFLGLGQLQPEQLASLWPRRTGFSRDALDEAVAAWIAITAADPRALPYLMRRVKALPFLAGAIERHLEEFPDALSGLSRTERQVLAAIARGTTGLTELVQQSAAIDPRYPATDTLVTWILADLGRAGLVDGAQITPLGRQALAGAADRVTEAGIDTWRGGVHLEGKGPVWRWDSASKKLLEK